VGEDHAVADEDAVADLHPGADERMAGDLAPGADHHPPLDLDERADHRPVPDPAAVDVDEIRVVDDHTLPELDVVGDQGCPSVSRLPSPQVSEGPSRPLPRRRAGGEREKSGFHPTPLSTTLRGGILGG